MANQPAAVETDLRPMIRNLFDALETNLLEVSGEDQELTENDSRLAEVLKYAGRPLMAEAGSAELSRATVHHLANLALAIIDGTDTPEHGRGSGRYRTLNGARQQLRAALAADQLQKERDLAQKLKHLSDVIEGLPPGLLQGLLNGLPTPLATDVVKSLIVPPLSEKLADILSGPVSAGLSKDLIAELPAPVATAVVSALRGVTPEQYDKLVKLANTKVDDVTTKASTEARINFLQSALGLLTECKSVPPGLLTEILGVVGPVLNYDDPAVALDSDDFYQLMTLRQQFTAFLQQPQYEEVFGNADE